VVLSVANTKYRKRRFAGCVLVSDAESWIYRDRLYAYGRQGATGVLDQWQQFVLNQVRLHGRGFTGPKLVCIDLQPYGSTQAPDRRDILNIGGFSDAVFKVVAAFLAENSGRFVAEVEAVEL
jgi:60 kDa SS-A/Ro ribonucleoprotein